MSDISSLPVPAQPLRRIVKPTPVARQRKMTIGRIAANSQLMANSFGRSTSIRRSISSDSSVRFPTWLLPALPARADDLDPYRDRDIIALRQARMKNRVVRQVQPRGLPMASHAHGRSRSGIETGPSSIARRLHPIRRQPSKNDAHIGPSTMPLVRVASQPQRPTARPPRTRSSATSAKNGNRTDRDGPRPRVVDSVKTVQFESHISDSFSTQGASTQSSLSPQSRPKFESVMVARSLLARPERSTADLPSVSTPDSTESSHRLTLPRASGRTSVDRSAIHRRTPSTRQPLVSPSSRIPLSMMYEAPRRLNPTSVASPTSRVNTTQSRQTSSAPSSSSTSVLARQTTRTSDQSVSPGPPTNRTVSAASNVGPNWTSFPTRESSSEQVSRKVISSDRAVTDPSATTPPSSQPLPKPQSSTLSSVTTSDTPISREKSAPATHRTAIDLTPPTSISMPIRNDNVSQSANSASVRRRVGAVHIPQAAGWRQVMGLSHQSEQPTTPQTASHHQVSLFRRVAALANPTNAPLGSPGDIARRSPVSGSLISIASSMRSAIHTQSGSSTPISSLNTDRTKVARKLGRKSASRSQKDAPTISEAKPPRNQVARSEQITPQGTKTRNVARRLKRSSPSTQPKRSSAEVRSTIKRSPLREQKPDASVTSLEQKPSFVQLWSSVNQSVARQSSLTARRSLRLPQVRVHSLSSKPGTIVRQQFGLDNPSTDTSFAHSSRSTVHNLRRHKSQRSNHALQSTSHGDPSTARVISVARSTRSHMSSVTPGASGGIQFAGSLAKAISLRQTHGDTARAMTASNKSRQSDTAVRRSPAPDSNVRSASPRSSRASSEWSGNSTSLTGAGSQVAQNFLDRLSRKTGEDFAPANTPDQGVSVSTSPDSDVISRSVSRTPRAESTNQYSEPTSERASRAMGDTASVTNARIMRSVVAHPAATPSESQPDQSIRAKGNQQRAVSSSSSPQSTSARSLRSQSSTTASRPRETNTGAKQSRQEIVERGGSIASRGALHRAVSRSVPTQRLSSPLNDLPVSPNVTPGMRIPSEAMSALPDVPNVARTSSSPTSTSSSTSSSKSSSISGATTSPGASISRSSSSGPSISRSASSPSSSSARRNIRRSVSIRRQANEMQFAPSEDGSISADALVRMIESGQSIPNQVVHRQLSGTTSRGIMRRSSSSGQVSRSASSMTIRRSSSAVEKAAPGPVSILSQVLAPADDSDSGTSQITTSQLLDLMDWINRIVDDRLRQELERRGVAGGRW